MHSFVLSDRKLIWGTFDKHIFYFTDSLLLWGNHAQVVLLPRPITFPHLKRESNQVILLISHFQDSANKSVEMATPDDEVNGFLSPREEKEWEEAEKGKVCLPKFAPPQPFDGTMKDTKSFVSSPFYIFMGGRHSFRVMSQKLCLCYLTSKGEKCSTGKMRPSILLQLGRSH